MLINHNGTCNESSRIFWLITAPPDILLSCCTKTCYFLATQMLSLVCGNRSLRICRFFWHYFFSAASAHSGGVFRSENVLHFRTLKAEWINHLALRIPPHSFLLKHAVKTPHVPPSLSLSLPPLSRVHLWKKQDGNTDIGNTVVLLEVLVDRYGIDPPTELPCYGADRIFSKRLVEDIGKWECSLQRVLLSRALSQPYLFNIHELTDETFCSQLRGAGTIWIVC